MKKICTALIILLLSLLCGVMAYAQTNVTVTRSGQEADVGEATVVDWSAEAAFQDDSDMGTGGSAAVPVRDAGAEAYPLSVEEITENGVAVVKKTYELPPGADPQTLVQPFERGGSAFSCREILRRELPGETLTRQASKAAITESESDDKAKILRQFPNEILHERDGYSGSLYLDAATISTEAVSYEYYSYPVTKTRDVPCLERNDPSYIDREWDGMALADISFEQGADGLYTAMAVYKGTASGQRPNGYVTTAVYRGEVTKETPGNVLYTVIYEGAEGQFTVESAECIVKGEETASSAPSPSIANDELSDMDPKLSAVNYALCTAIGLAVLSGTVITPLYMASTLKRERKKAREEIEELKSRIRAGELP